MPGFSLTAKAANTLYRVDCFHAFGLKLKRSWPKLGVLLSWAGQVMCTLMMLFLLLVARCLPSGNVAVATIPDLKQRQGRQKMLPISKPLLSWAVARSNTLMMPSLLAVARCLPSDNMTNSHGTQTLC